MYIVEDYASEITLCQCTIFHRMVIPTVQYNCCGDDYLYFDTDGSLCTF